MSEPRWQRNEDWVGSEIDDAFVMVNIDSGKYVALNPTANAIWQALSEPSDQPTIEKALREVYDVSEAACGESVTTVLAQMQELQLASQL